ncbi:MAG: NAD(P)H-dependent oxidoreductase [Elusimicrobia bacterium]|nr:NAD(P)H-dependent oxidoreductase [Elusimicrobiota bacterium]
MTVIAPDATAAVTPDALLSSLRWRIATKKFDAARKIPAPLWSALEESLVLAPSSYGLQPYKFFVVEDKALRVKLQPASWGQSQIVDADKLVVFAVKKDLGPDHVERFIERISEVRRLPKEALEQYKKMMLGSVSQEPARVQAWAIRQVYITLGVFLTSAAALGVDACPMEGIDQTQYDQILGLPAKGWNAVFVATAGYRACDDAYAKLAKVRFEKNELLEKL